MLLCVSCHNKSSCRTDVHLDIKRGKCLGCGHMADCFDCIHDPILRRVGIPEQQIMMYRNTKPLKYRKKGR